MTLQLNLPRPYPASELVGQTPIWLLELDFAGRTLRYSTRPTTVTTLAGKRLDYLGAMPGVAVAERSEILSGGDTPIAPTASVEILPGFDIAALVEQGHRLDTAWCRLAWWVPGSAYERRQVLVEGYLSGVSYGGPGEPIAGTIEPEPPSQDDPILPATWRIGPETEIGVEPRIEAEDGTYYPLVIGSPGYYWEKTVGVSTVSKFVPAYRAPRWEKDGGATGNETTKRLLITGGTMARVGDLRIAGRGETNSQKTLPVDTLAEGTDEQDGLFQALTHVSLTDEWTEAEREATDWYVAFGRPDQPTASASGLAKRRRGLRLASIDIAPGEPDQVLMPVRTGDVFVSAELEVTTAFDASDRFRLGDAFIADRYAFSGADLETVGTYKYRGPVDCREGDLLYDHIDDGSTIGAARLTVEVLPAEAEGIETLGELILWLILKSRVRTDLSEWVAIARQFPQPVGGVITDGSKTYWDVLRKEVLPLTPIDLRWGPNGVRPLVWPWLGLAGRSVRHLRVGDAGVVRLPDVRYATPSAEMVSEVRIEYSWSALADGYADTHLLTAVPERRESAAYPTGKEWDASNGDINLLRQRFGARRTDSFSTRWVYSRETAGWIARWRLALLGMGYRHLTLEGPADLGSLDIGNVVTVTDLSIHLDAIPGVIVGWRRTDAGRVSVEVAIRGEQDGLTTGPNADDGPRRPDGQPRGQ